MSSTNNAWLLTHLGVIFLALISGGSWARSVPEIGWTELIIIGAAIPLMLIFVIGTQLLNPRSALVWERMSFFKNPFNPGQPLQFFHLPSWYFLVSGFMRIARVISSGSKLAADDYILLAIGAGGYIGLHLCQLIYRRKFVSAD